MFYGPFAYGGWSWLGFGLHGALMVVIWALVIWAIIALVRATTRGTASPTPPASDNALALLRERYARGELTDEQFKQMREALH